MLARAQIGDGQIRVRDEAYDLLILPPMTHLKISTVEQLERFASAGGRLLSMIFLPDRAFASEAAENEPGAMLDISERMEKLFGVDPGETQRTLRQRSGIDIHWRDAGPDSGAQESRAAFLQSYALTRQLPWRWQEHLGETGRPESPHFVIESKNEVSRYFVMAPGSERQEITDEVTKERQAVYDALQTTLNKLIDPDVTIDHPDIFYLHRVKEDQDIYFFVNPTFTALSAQVSIGGEVQPVLWDPSAGSQRLVAPFQVTNGRTRFQIDLPPVGSAIIHPQPLHGPTIVETNLSTIENLEMEKSLRLTGHGAVEEAFVVIEHNGESQRKTARARRQAQPLVLDGEWEFQAEDHNALVIGRWLATQEQPGQDWQAYAMPNGNVSDWLPMVPGAWSYQLPAEPEAPYPIAVGYRIEFAVDHLPAQVNLIVDGFAGSEWQLYVNGEQATSPPVRSAIDSQMKAVDITSSLKSGNNLIALRLVVTKSTDGLLDLLKIMGDFSLEVDEDDAHRVTAPRTALYPQSWTDQGFPFYSGSAVYRRRFQLPQAFEGQRIFLQPQLEDDVLEVLVNGEVAGVHLWPGYETEISDWLRAGENVLELRVTNTLVNLLEAVPRPSGLAGPPALVAHEQFTFDFSDEV